MEMRKKIENALSMAKRIVSAVANEYGCDDFRSRIVTIEDSDEIPFAEILLTFKGKEIKTIQIQDNGQTLEKKIREEQVVDEIHDVISALQEYNNSINLVFLGD